MKTVEIQFLITVAGYRITDHKGNGNVREELGIADIGTIIEKLSKAMAATFVTLPRIQIPKLLYPYKSEVRKIQGRPSKTWKKTILTVTLMINWRHFVVLRNTNYFMTPLSEVLLMIY
jgi:hypothetical protein